jgi:hypothetical protein
LCTCSGDSHATDTSRTDGRRQISYVELTGAGKIQFRFDFFNDLLRRWSQLNR